MIVQNVSAATTGRTDISFTLPKSDAATALRALSAEQVEVGFESLVHDDQIGKLSVVGAGMRTHSGVSATLFEALSAGGINIEMISTSEIRISVVTHSDVMEKAVAALHTAFGLDSDNEATVYDVRKRHYLNASDTELRSALSTLDIVPHLLFLVLSLPTRTNDTTKRKKCIEYWRIYAGQSKQRVARGIVRVILSTLVPPDALENRVLRDARCI